MVLKEKITGYTAKKNSIQIAEGKMHIKYKSYTI